MNAEVSRAPNPILTWPLHPFLFAVASVLALMASNLNQVSPMHVVGALLGALVFAAAVYALAFMIWRDGARAGLIASIWVVGSLFYAAVFGALNDLVEGGFEMVRSLPLALAALVVLTFVAARLPHSVVRILAVILNCLAAVMVATPGLQAAAFEWRNGASRAIYDPYQAAEALPPADPAQQQGDRPPDIYHFVFDRYASPTTLAEYYGYDDSPLVAFLEDRGFRVLRDAHSNYHRTAHSLASTFYMDYLDLFDGKPDLAGSSNWQPVLSMLADHRAGRFLKARGYRFIQFGSWWTGTFHNRLADENRPHGLNEFDMLYLRRTVLRPLLHLLPDAPETSLLDWDNAQCHRVKAQIEEIKAIGEQDQPVYVFAHFLVPHGPYNFSPEGECLTMEQSGRRGLEKGYLEQVEYAGRIIRELVPALQADRQNPAAIIIQSDEGPFPAREPNVAWQDQPDPILRIKTGILSAYSIPGADEIDEHLTPVNTYRILFNALFGTKFERLPDRTFVVPDDDHLYEFHDVTGRVRALD